jgi:hypothetical protein
MKALREIQEENEVNSKSKSEKISEERKIEDFDSNFLNTENERKKKIENNEKEMKKNEVENIETVKDPPNDNLLKNPTNMNNTQEEINEILKQPIHSDAKPTQCDKWNERQLAKKWQKRQILMKKT